ncbi:zinc finger protein 1 [Sitodiplosis mosellana]|uniref:zinc finger protein 1 n=1 Tax=Sitodiplosis mosellana TaxID=263140 RepID=UPI002444C00E|nr:zinc finger protein 1 [Sitodiplosis mosellana]
MTMDIAQQEREDMKMLSPRLTCEIQNKNDLIPQTIKPSVKRSFDVAFLMLPDEKLKNKHPEKQARLQSDAIVTYRPQINVKNDDGLRKMFEKRNELLSNGNPMKNGSSSNFQQTNNNNNNDMIKNGRFFPQDLTFISHDLVNRVSEAPKSAFTKVPNVRQVDSPIPPAPSLSPGQLSCPSTSPPISSSPPQNPIYPFRSEYQLINSSPFQTTISQMHQLAQNEKLRQQFAYRPPQHHQQNGDLPHSSSYLTAGNFPFAGAGAHPFVAQPDLSGIVRNPAAAAALLSTLIPPTIATSFSLTAQNVCAKCNISFRMTSDLVYHMRSHHKSEYAGDTNRRKREEKLKCPVCNESFRERHHLTRHMTAHQTRLNEVSDELENGQVQRRQK